MKLGTWVRVLPSEYSKAGKIGIYLEDHSVLAGQAWVTFGGARRELIKKRFLEPVDHHDDDPDPYRSPTRPEHDLDLVGRPLKPGS